MAMVGNLEARGTLKELALVGLTRMYAEPKPLIVRPERKIAPEKPSASS
jgi:hypothetical protein